MSELTEPMTIDVVSDVVCPWCYIGKRRFERAVDELDAGVRVAVAWRSFQLHPEQSTSAIIIHHPEAKYFTID